MTASRYLSSRCWSGLVAEVALRCLAIARSLLLMARRAVGRWRRGRVTVVGGAQLRPSGVYHSVVDGGQGVLVGVVPSSAESVPASEESELMWYC